jgi:hypothetical protein
MALHAQRRFWRQQVACFRDPALAAEDLSGKDQRLRTGAALGQAAIDQKLVGPLFQGGCSSGRVPSVPSARCTMAATRASASASLASQCRRNAAPRS